MEKDIIFTQAHESWLEEIISPQTNLEDDKECKILQRLIRKLRIIDERLEIFPVDAGVPGEEKLKMHPVSLGQKNHLYMKTNRKEVLEYEKQEVRSRR